MTASKIEIHKVCEDCGKTFVAWKSTTRFCSKTCNSRAYKQFRREQRIAAIENETNTRPIEKIRDKKILSPKEVAVLLGLSTRNVYYLIDKGLLKASHLSTRITLIKRKDIDVMLDDNHEKRKRKSSQPITEFYTTSEILQKYGISESGLYKIAKSETFPKVFQRGKSYWSKKHIDSYFGKKAVDASITEWYSVADIKETFNMTTTAVYTFVSNFKIPKKRIKKDVLYSRRHVDIAKGIAEPDTPQYYTIKEAMAKFHVTRDQLYHYAKTYNIPKVQEGKYVKLSKKELDELFAPPTIKG